MFWSLSLPAFIYYNLLLEESLSVKELTVFAHSPSAGCCSVSMVKYQPSEASLLASSTLPALTPALTYSWRLANKPRRRLVATDSMCKHLDFLPGVRGEMHQIKRQGKVKK